MRVKGLGLGHSPPNKLRQEGGPVGPFRIVQAFMMLWGSVVIITVLSTSPPTLPCIFEECYTGDDIGEHSTGL